MLYLFSALAGLITIVDLITSNGNIEYVSGGVITTINSSGFLSIPILLTIIAFFGIINMRTGL